MITDYKSALDAAKYARGILLEVWGWAQTHEEGNAFLDDLAGDAFGYAVKLETYLKTKQLLRMEDTQ